MMTRYPSLFLICALLSFTGCSEPVENSPVAQGKASFAAGEWDAAVEAFSTAIAKNPLDVEAYLFRGQSYMCKGREHVGQALADYNEAIRLDGKHHEAYYLRALAYKERGETDKAYADETKARKLDPSVAKIRPARPMPSLETYEKTLELTRELGGAPQESIATEEFESFPEREPIPGVKQPAREAGKGDDGDDAVTSSGKAYKGDEARDAYGLPLPAKRVGSITEQLFGSDAVSLDDEEPVTPRRPIARRRPPAIDWQSQAPAASPLPPGDSAPSARRPSPIGTLPFGNPYQPRGGNPYSPYSNPYGPRSTGLHSGSAMRDYSIPGGGYSGRDPNALPRSPGGQPPLVDPR